MLKKLQPGVILIICLWLSSTIAATALGKGNLMEKSAPPPAPAISSSTGCPLFFVTDRKAIYKKDKTEFSAERSGELVFGAFNRNAQTDSIKDGTMTLFQSENDFLSKIKAADRGKMAVFVHGYRKSFNGSMDFGLQIARHLDVPLVVFAWPSRNNYAAYMADECTAEWSCQDLSRLLRDLGQSAGYGNITIVAHSLGARMVQWSLKDLYAETRPGNKFAAALFFSPDIDRDIFKQDAGMINEMCSVFNIYSDQHDTRIWLSKLLHGSPRLGSNDNKIAGAALTGIHQYDTGLNNHQIPYKTVAAAVHKASTTP
jgi:esterase/lipase superfamily enzyme